MELFKHFFNRKFREEYSKEISFRVNNEQYEYDNLYFSIIKDIELKDDNTASDEINNKE